MNSKADVGQKSLVIQRIEFKGIIWQEYLPGASQLGAHKESNTLNNLSIEKRWQFILGLIQSKEAEK